MCCPGVIGLLQAVETVKLLSTSVRPLVGRLLQYDALEPRFTSCVSNRDPGCGVLRRPATPFPGYVDYEHACSASGPALSG